MNISKAESNPVLVNAVFFLLILAAVIMLNRFSGHSYDIQEVTLPDAKSLYDSGALVIDVRSEDAYLKRHIVGAISIPLAVLRNGIPDSIAHAKDKPMVVYCGDGVTIGPEGTHLLNQAGFTQAVNIKEGISGWESAGYPVQK